MSDTHGTSSGTPKKTKTADIISKIILYVGIIAISYGLWYYFSDKWNVNINKETGNIEVFSTEGNGYATKNNPVKAYLDPKLSYTRHRHGNGAPGIAKAKYVLASNHHLFFISSDAPEDTSNINAWAEMPAGNYLIYPIDEEGITFWWYK
ncbi:MAG: hypothetical protein V4504_00930 [Patescibacteria group bacterium]